MSLQNPVSLGDVHSELSCLLFAAQQEFKDVYGALCTINYNQHTYLNLEVEVFNEKDAKRVQDRLVHGIFWGEFDYRFSSVGKPCGIDEGNRRVVSAVVDLQNSKRRPDLYRGIAA